MGSRHPSPLLLPWNENDNFVKDIRHFWLPLLLLCGGAGEGKTHSVSSRLLICALKRTHSAAVSSFIFRNFFIFDLKRTPSLVVSSFSSETHSLSNRLLILNLKHAHSVVVCLLSMVDSGVYSVALALALSFEVEQRAAIIPTLLSKCYSVSSGLLTFGSGH